ncbi:MAG TPA: LysR family transcriptional regulator [Mycobacteriales bacterium]|jgi:DNA-binding transcriptional LysR family regulator|nr:LysR family transcriptional regulator [Mycobacteriales bacterium]
MNLDHVRQFVAVGDELHFGRAAQTLGIAQPALSRTIKRLEAQLGVTLFDRSGRHVTLTPAGRAYLDESRRLLDQAALTEQRARRAAMDNPPIRIGFFASAMFELLPDAIRQFHRVEPDTAVELDEGTPAEQLTALREGRLDLAVVQELAPPLDDLHLRPVLHSRFFAALPAHWSLARRASVRLAELSDVPFVDTAAMYSPVLHEHLVTACHLAGFEPKFGPKASSLMTTLGLVASGMGLSFTHALVRSVGIKGVAFVPICDPPDFLAVTVSLARLRRPPSAALRSLETQLETVARRFDERS